MNIYKNKKEISFLVFFFLLALFFRVNYINGNHFQFHFEQARDALVSRNIFENKDLKIQGPSAGNTQGTIYHGVLYYYIIGPIYFLFHGNPVAVVYWMAILSSSAVIPIYLLAKEISNNKKVAILSSILYVFSLDSTQMGTHLQNVSLATISIPWLFYFFCKVFFKKQKKYFPFLALALGITHQFGIYLGYFLLPLFIFYFLQVVKKRKIKLFNFKEIFSFFIIYLLSISTMIITQIKLWKAGIFKLDNLSSAVSSQNNLFQSLKEMFSLYSQKLANSYLTPFSYITLGIILLSFIYFWKQSNKNKKISIFLLIWLISPLFLFILVPRKIYYMMVGTAPAILILYSVVIYNLRKSLLQRLLAISLIFLFIFSNFKIANMQKINAKSPLYVSAQLKHELQLIDKTYELAQGEEFSISTLTSPYGVNSTWSYLYDWYGKKKYGYAPLWFGPNQRGLPGEDFLEETTETYPLHFTIIEPATVSEKLKKEFLEVQDIYSANLVSSYTFQELLLEQRRK